MIIGILVGIVILGLGLFVLLKNIKRQINIIFFLICSFLSLWTLTSTLADLSTNYSLALFFARMAIVGPLISLPLFLYFSYIFPNGDPSKKQKYFLFWFLIPVFFFLPFIFTKYNVENITLREGWTEFKPGFLYTALFLLLIFYFGYGCIRFLHKLRTLDGFFKIQIKYVLLSIAIVAVFGTMTNLIFPLLGYSRSSVFGPSLSVFFVIFISYSIVKYRLMDIRIVIGRALIYAILVSLITGGFVFATFIGTQFIAQESTFGQVAILTVASLLVVLLLDPIKNLLAKATNKIFFKAAIDYPAVTKNLTDVINQEIELDHLIKRFCISLETELRLKHATILLPVGENTFMDPEELRQVAPRDKRKKKQSSTFHNAPLITHLLKNQNLVVLDELDRKVADAQTPKERNQFDAVRTSLEKMGGYVAVPIDVKDKVEAILILSRKLSGDIFSINDIQLLEVISPQMASGIQKARLYQEAKQFSSKLEREVKKATAELQDANAKLTELDKAKSEFMSIASHQLRTPLTGIIGYLSMMNDGDFGAVASEQKTVIHDILGASQRLARLVNVFLNVTRIEAGRFVMNYATVPFSNVIEDVYKELKPTAEKKQLKLTYKKTTLPEVEVDIDKIKDVLLNLTDNAIKYTEKGSVTISATTDEDSVHVIIQDTGIGIDPVEAKNLFSKFVRGSEIARVNPNGSGLGLYIVKKVVEGHGGNIWVESKGKGKGSAFHFEIPIHADHESIAKAEEFKAQALKVK